MIVNLPMGFSIAAVLAFVLVVAVRLPGAPHDASTGPATRAADYSTAAIRASSAASTARARDLTTATKPPQASSAPVDVERALEVLNSGIGDDGKPVDRGAVERALQTDSELRDALGN